MKKKSRDYYLEILNLSEDFNISALKKAYRREAKKWHPDLNKEKILAEERIKLINEAYEFLKTSKRRRATKGKESTANAYQKESTKRKESTANAYQKESTKRKESTANAGQKNATREKKSRFFSLKVTPFTMGVILITSIQIFPSILWKVYSPPKYYTDSIKASLVNGIKECFNRYLEKKSTKFSDSQFFSSNNYEGYYMSTLVSINNSNTCFQAQAFPELRFQDKLTRFDIELNLRTGIISKTCDDPSKYGCNEGNTW